MYKLKTLISVFANEQSKAERKLGELISGKHIFKRTKNTVDTGAEYFRVFKWSENLIGCKAHEIYVDVNIDNEAILCCIIPCLIRKNDNDEWDWQEHIHYF
ncbi:hypothetical protein [Paenibacillus xylaniclasticus]|uniref:hypothetical protein n=1 Tax=Paenibacillus xylaniclasticus TaxID=588083 RepID=UPI000FD9D0E9|nr:MULTISPECIES: hypothetical protein [Paenibacillus]GFN32474.1 hypothetical protein PCURB6_27340 [Paenibacillus curdlanolyticus]